MSVKTHEMHLTMLLGLFQEQEKRGVERACLQSLVVKIRACQRELEKAKELEPESEAPQGPIPFEDEKDPSDFHYNKPIKWGCRKTVRKSTQLTTRRAHPIPMPWHGRLA